MSTADILYYTGDKDMEETAEEIERNIAADYNKYSRAFG